MSGLDLLFLFILGIPVRNANSADPDQAPRSVVSGLGLHCLPLSLYKDNSHKWFKT